MLALLLAAAAISPGLYRSHQIEVAAALELSGDGRFRYALDYGAVSETGEGKWTAAGDVVRLTSDPLPALPRFVLVKDEPAPAGEVSIAVAQPGLNWGSPLRVAVTFGTGAAVLALDGDGRVPLNGRLATTVTPLLPIYEAATEPVALAPGGHRLLFRFEPRDMGKARFVGEPLAIDGTTLVLRRYDTVIRLTRHEPGVK